MPQPLLGPWWDDLWDRLTPEPERRPWTLRRAVVSLLTGVAAFVALRLVWLLLQML